MGFAVDENGCVEATTAQGDVVEPKHARWWAYDWWGAMDKP
jgi:hypothetical protein